MSATKGILVVDAENILALAHADERTWRYPIQNVVRATLIALERTANRSHIDVQWRIAAFAFPRLNQQGNNRRARDAALQTLGVSLQMETWGYMATTVNQKKDAADEMITRMALAFLEYWRIRVCILATQDSGRYFTQFIKATLKQAKSIHLVGHTYIPETLASLGNFHQSLLGEEIAQILEQEKPPTPYRPATVPRKNFIRDLRIFLKNPYARINSEHRGWISQALACIEKFTQGSWNGTFGELLYGVKSHWQGPAPPQEEFREMIGLFVSIPELFKAKSVLSYENNPDFIDGLRDALASSPPEPEEP